MREANEQALQVLVSQQRSVKVCGVYPPGHRGKTYDWRGKPGSAENSERIRAECLTMTLGEALVRRFATNAMLSAFTMFDSTGQTLPLRPRVCKSALPWVREQGFDLRAQVLLVDVDNPGHGDWTADLLQRHYELWNSAPSLERAGIYYTQHGLRLLLALDRPITPEQYEDSLAGWCEQLRADGIEPDRATTDWTRVMGAPWVWKNGRQQRWGEPDTDRMVLVPPPVPAAGARKRSRAAAGGVLVGDLPWENEVPPGWEERVRLLGPAVREEIAAGTTASGHGLLLALAGALSGANVPATQVPAVIRAVACEAGLGEDLVRAHEATARDVVARREANREAAEPLPVAGLRSLERWPGVVRALHHALARELQKPGEPPPADPPPAPPAAEAARLVERALEQAYGVEVVNAECGLGKTRAAIEVAVRRAASPKKSERRTSISVDKHALARQVADDLRARGVPVLRLFSPPSLEGPDGRPVCRYAASARALAAGGQSVSWELCQGRGKDPCEWADGCPAALGREGPLDAPVAVGPHALLGQLVQHAGRAGLVVVDEPPPLLETERFEEEDFRLAELWLDSFSPRYTVALRPVLDAARRWLEASPPDERRDVQGVLVEAGLSEDLVREACEVTRTPRTGDLVVDAVEAVRAALRPPDDRPSKRPTHAPPLRRVDVVNCRGQADRAETLGRVSRLFRTVHTEVARDTPGSWRVEARPSGRELVVTAARPEVILAFGRTDGATVLCDAGADVHLPVVKLICGYDPKVTRVSAGDGARWERTWLVARRANRAGWFPHRVPAWERGLKAAVQAMISWAKEDDSARVLAVIAPRVLEVAIRATLAPGDPSHAEAWKALGQPAVGLERAREALGPILAQWPGEILLGHYGATRGLNTMSGCDALATLGDPVPNLGDVRADLSFLGLDNIDWTDRLYQLTQVELEQAHGRARTVHRTRPGRALHLGAIRPGGSGWIDCAVRQLPPGRPPRPVVATVEQLTQAAELLGGVRALARQVGVSPSTAQRWVEGECRPPVTVSQTVLSLLLPQEKNPVLSGS